MTYWIAREIPADLGEAGLAVARAFDVRERPFHFEFFRLPDGSLRPIEVNMRPPGGPSVDMANWANDIDFYQAWANVIVHGVHRDDHRPTVGLHVRRPARGAPVPPLA